MDEIDKRGWAVGRAEGHDCVCPLDGVDPLECQLFLTFGRDGKLMIAHRSVKHPPPLRASEFVEHRGIATRNWVSDCPSDAIEWDVVDAEALDKVFDIANVLLMGFHSEQSLEQPTSIRDLPDVANLG